MDASTIKFCWLIFHFSEKRTENTPLARMSDDRNSHLSTASVILPLYYLMSPEKFSTLTAQEDPDYVVTLNTTQVTPQVCGV